MLTRHYALRPGGEKRLKISHDLDGRSFRVWFDGRIVRPEGLTGTDFRLPNGSFLSVTWVEGWSGVFHVEPVVDGRVLPGSFLHPATRVRLAAAVCGVYALLHVLESFAPVVAFFGGPLSHPLKPVPVLVAGAWYAVLGGGLFLRSRVAALAALASMLAEAIFLTNVIMGTSEIWGWVWLYVPLPLLAQAFVAIQLLRESEMPEDAPNGSPDPSSPS